MNKGHRLQQLEDTCRDIIKINMWYELPDYVFFSISDTIDGTSDEFAINVYKNIDRSLLEILLHPSVLLSVVESLQSNTIAEYIVKLCGVEMDYDDLLISDVKLCLFSNYGFNNSESVALFNKIYRELKDIVKSSRVHIDHDKDIFDGLDKILAFSDKNKYEYFLYIKAYWLSLYFCEISQKVRERDKLSFYYDEFSVRFPNVVLYPTYYQLHGLASESHC
ncbi:TPA: aminopeptidase [Escherichia coli]|uniref:aminopeptidase n=1 Tax=Escherichia coli TaxID=562 RepID=UPI00287922ED|nr:aminopeptidase [Escherichia coli]MDS1599798.1 aminopeptidase [Escherichia coli]HAW1061181.1 aminopeptidase [Escherichia coli]